MTFIIFCFIIWGVCKALSYGIQSARESKRQEEIERIKREQAMQKEQIKRDNAQQKAIEAEQRRQAKELEKHEAWLKKHDEEIEKLNFKIERAEADIEHLTMTLSDFNESFELACEEASRYHANGDTKREEQAKRRVITLRNQIHSTETKLAKAKFTKAEAEAKLSA